jgi:hypothetical protein
MSRKQGPRAAGMRPSARAEGSLHSNGEPTGFLLAGAAASRRYDVLGNCTVATRGDGMRSGHLRGYGLQGVIHGH